MRIPLVLSEISKYFILGISTSSPLWIQGWIKFLWGQLGGDGSDAAAAGPVERPAPFHTYHLTVPGATSGTQLGLLHPPSQGRSPTLRVWPGPSAEEGALISASEKAALHMNFPAASSSVFVLVSLAPSCPAFSSQSVSFLTGLPKAHCSRFSSHHQHQLTCYHIQANLLLFYLTSPTY